MGPLYDLVLVLHALAAFAGFGALAATGGYARAARLAGPGSPSPAVRRYFAPGPNVGGAALFLVPVLGVLLLGLGHWQDAGAPYPWVGLALWLTAAGLATGSAWPAEREVRALLAEGAPGRAGGPPPANGAPQAPARLATACRRCERAAALTSLCFLVALFFMAVQPG